MISVKTLILFISFLLNSWTVLGGQFRILILLPETGDPFWKYSFGTEMSGAAALIAIDEVNNKSVIPGHTLAADFVNTGCKPVVGLGVAADALHAKNYSCVVGPPCSTVCRHVARLLVHKNLPCFNGVCQGIEMLDKNEFKTLTRLLGTFDLVGKAVKGFCQHFNWQRIGIIAQRHTDPIWTLTRDGVALIAEEKNFTVASKLTIDGNFNEDGQGLTNLQIMKQTTNNSRIIVVAVRGETFRDLMLHAYDLNLINGEYVFICINFYTQKRVYGDFDWYRNDSRDGEAKRAYEGVVWVNYFEPDTNEYRQFQVDVRTRAQQAFNFQYQEGETTPYQASNLYEAVWMYALSLNETLATGGNLMNGTLISQRLWGRSFPSITGSVTLNKNGDREQGYTLWQTRSGGQKEEVGFYFSKSGYYEMKPGSKMTWAAGSTVTPKDSPACGWDFELCQTVNTDQQVLLATLLSVLFVLLVVGGIAMWAIYRRMKWMKEVADMRWKIKYDNIVLIKGGNNSHSRISINTSAAGSSNGGMPILVKTGMYNGTMVAVKKISHKKISLSQHFLHELKQLSDLNHANLARFVGACVDPPNTCLITEFCSKASLEDVLSNEDIQLDWTFKYSLIQDIIKGLLFIKTSFLKHHGNLKTSNCLLDSRFVVKLADFGLRQWREWSPRDLLWTAPEVLRESYCKVKDKEAADVYSFGIILQEILIRQGPFSKTTPYDHDDIIKQVQSGVIPLFRPDLLEHDCPSKIDLFAQMCWEEEPYKRPRIAEMKETMKDIAGSLGKKGSNIMDNLLQRMELYANNLEGLVEERTGKYLEEKRRVEDLLHRLLPKSIADQLQAKGFVEPESFSSVTIYFSDIVGFTSLSADSSPLEIVNMLNDLYGCFDEILDKYNVYKVETIGDAYMVVSGLPVVIKNHAEEIASMSLELLDNVQQFKIRHRPEKSLQLRIGIHSGSVVAGVVGHRMPRYCLFGDTVNTASRMESTSEALKIQVSSSTQHNLSIHGKFVMVQRGSIDIKGKGSMLTYWLEGMRPS